MDARNYARYLRVDFERQREEAWLAMHRRPDAEPLPEEPERTWSERVIGLRWLTTVARAARRVPLAGRRGLRSPAGPAAAVSTSAGRARPASRHR